MSRTTDELEDDDERSGFFRVILMLCPSYFGRSSKEIQTGLSVRFDHCLQAEETATLRTQFLRVCPTIGISE